MDVEIDTECCRTCLTATKDNYLFKQPELVKKLEFATSLRIIEGDGLPIYFCNSCQEKLEIVYEFRLQSIRTYKHLKNHLLQIQNQFKNIVKNKTNCEVEQKNSFCLLKNKNVNQFPAEECTKSKQAIAMQDNNETDPLFSEIIVTSTSCIKTKNVEQYTNNSKKLCNKAKKTGNINNDDELNENCGVEFSKCDICHKMFKKGNLRRHRQTHTDDKKFVCKVCNKTFTQKSSLQRHHLIHTGEKPFKCGTCGKCFSQSKTLKFHMTLHGEEKTFKCSICRYRFIKAENLANHMREKHSSGNSDEVILFVCQFCNKGFRSNKSLQVHKEKLHKDDIVFDMEWSDINSQDSDESE